MKLSATPFISIIIDNYNYARFLPDAINSALHQDYKNYEIIVVDDASTDNSREVILSYGNKVKPVFQEKNSGQGAAFNAGFKASQGEIICLLDADDLFHADKLSIVKKTADENPDAVLIYNLGHYINKNQDALKGMFPKKIMHGNVSKRLIRHAESLFPPTSFLSFRRRFLDKVLPLAPYLNRIDADFPLQMLAGVMGKVVAIKQSLGYYRLHGDNWFSNNELERLDFETIHRLTRRTEKSFDYINTKLAELNIQERINLFNHRFHRRNLFMLNQVGWRDLLTCALVNPNFINLRDRLSYVAFGIRRRLQYNAMRS
jgi:glycosyltransferase involved in cell wall biosynthesis